MSVRITNLAPTPPMGWNSFDAYGVYLDEETALATLAVMKRRLLASGYRYFVIDMGWYSEYKNSGAGVFPLPNEQPQLCIDPFARYVPSQNIFPRGLGYVADRAHEQGLLFGLHLMRGIPRKAVADNLPIEGTKFTARDIADMSSVCRWNDFNYGVDMTRPGAQAYYDSVVRLIASWGVDFIKADDIVEYPAEIEALATAIEAQDRPIVLSLSPGNLVNYAHMRSFQRANMVRLTRDVWDRRICIERCFDAWKDYHASGAGGFWPDLDMIPIGHLRLCLTSDRLLSGVKIPSEGVERWCQWSLSQQRTFLTMLALAASPMFMGGSLLDVPDEVIALLTQPEIIACNQNGVVGRMLLERSGVEVWTTEARNGVQEWVGVFNRTQSATRIGFAPEALGWKSGERVHEVWSGREVLLSSELEVGADGVMFFMRRRVGADR